MSSQLENNSNAAEVSSLASVFGVCFFISLMFNLYLSRRLQLATQIYSQTQNNSNVAGESKKDSNVAEKSNLEQEGGTIAASIEEEADPLSENYGQVPVQDLQSKAVTGRIWTEIELVDENLKDQKVLIRGQVQTICPVGKNIGYLVLREKGYTIPCVLTVADNLVSRQMVKFASSLTKESIVDIEGIVSVPGAPIKETTQQVELHVRKIYCISKALPMLPSNIHGTGRGEADSERALQDGEQPICFDQNKPLSFRGLDLRTPAYQAIFRIQHQVENSFVQHLISEDFDSIHTPKVIAGSSEGGASVFKLHHQGLPACLAQSPQLHTQMAICGGLGSVFEIAPVFREEEDSFTHRHLCEFTGLDVEMEIKEHYSEVMDLVDVLFVAMFDHLNEFCKKELEALGNQYPFEPLKYLRETLKLTFEEGVQMLKEAGIEVDPHGALNTEAERNLGKLVLEKYGTEFYILHRYPLAARPFYTMPSYDSPEHSNSFDAFIRGEVIISGAQRVHDPEFLSARAEAHGIDLKSIGTYIDAFRYGAPPHGGFRVGLERVVMLFCGLNNSIA